jgi:hypothetical protein
MRDPFFPPPPILVQAVRPTADYLGLSTLPFHLHEVVFAWICYHLIDTILSPVVSTWLFPSIYPSLPPRRRINWNVHFTSFIQSSFITTFALFVIWRDEDRKEMDWVGRLWGYTGAGGAVQACAAGYFMWDLVASIVHFNVLGWGSLAHAISALLVTSIGFVSQSCSHPLWGIGWLTCRFGAASIRHLLRLKLHPVRNVQPFHEYPLVSR